MKLVIVFVSILGIQFQSNTQLSTQQNIWKRIDERATQLIKGRTEVSKLEDINSAFSEFYERFINDSTFQINRISESVLAVIGHCESTDILTRQNWEIISSHYREDYNDPKYEHLIISDESVFYMRSSLIEIDVISEMGFERIEGNWYITLFMVNAC